MFCTEDVSGRSELAKTRVLCAKSSDHTCSCDKNHIRVFGERFRPLSVGPSEAENCENPLLERSRFPDPPARTFSWLAVG